MIGKSTKKAEQAVFLLLSNFMFLILGYLLAGVFLSKAKFIEYNSGSLSQVTKTKNASKEVLYTPYQSEPVCSEMKND
jgi:hypothetical protein